MSQKSFIYKHGLWFTLICLFIFILYTGVLAKPSPALSVDTLDSPSAIILDKAVNFSEYKPNDNLLFGPTGNAILIANTANFEDTPDIACSTYFCMNIWREGGDIKARVISGDSQLGSVTLLGNINGQLNAPTIIYKPDQDEFLAVYRRTSPTALISQRLTINSANTISYTTPITFLPGSFRNPAIAHISAGSPNYSTLALYQDYSNDQIKGTWLNDAGSTTVSFDIPLPLNTEANSPALASNDSGAFVAWVETSTLSGNSAIYGCFLAVNTPTNGCSAPKMLISNNTTADAAWPDVTYNSLTEAFAIVWQENGRIYVATSDAQTVTIPQEIATISATNAYPTITFNQQDNTFLSVWLNDETNHALVGHYLATNGTPLDSSGQPGQAVFTIDTTTPGQPQPTTTYHHASGRYLALWVDGTVSDYDISGQFITPISEVNISLIGNNNLDEQPVATCDTRSGANQCLVAGVTYQNGIPSLTAKFAYNTLPFTHTVPISLTLTPGISYTQPSAYFIPSNQIYLLLATTYGAGDGDIHAWWIDPTGQISSQVPLVTGLNNQTNPAVVFNESTLRLIVAWEDDTSGKTAIWHRVFEADGNPIGLAQQVSSVGETGLKPALATAGSSGNLIVWEQEDSDDHRIARRTLDPNGDLVGIPSLFPAPLNQKQPVVVTGNGSYLVTWQDQRMGNTVYSQLVDFSGGTIGTNTQIFGGELTQCDPPAITYKTNQQKMYVVSACQMNGSKTVYAQWVRDTGQLIGQPIEIPLNPTQSNQQHPVVAHNNNLSLFFAWEDDYYGTTNLDIYGRFFPLTPDLSTSSMLVRPLVATPTQILTVSVTISNLHGLASAQNGVVISYLSPEATYIVDSATNDAVFSAPNQIHWTGDIPAGDEISFQYQVQLSPSIPDDQTLIFTTTVEAIENPLFMMSQVITVTSQAQLFPSTFKVDKTTSTPGEPLTYTLVVINGGTDVAQNTIADLQIPANTTYISGSAVPTPDSSTINNLHFNLGNVAVGEMITITYGVTTVIPLPHNSTIHNQATLSATSLTVPITRTVSTTMTSFLNLTASIRVEPELVEPRDYFTYTVTITNNGTVTATSNMFTAPLPTHTTFVDDSLGGITYIASTSTISHNFENLLPGQPQTLDITLRLAPVVTNNTVITFSGLIQHVGVSTSTTLLVSSPVVSSSPRLNLSITGPILEQACPPYIFDIQADNLLGGEHATSAVLTVTLPATYNLLATSYPYSTSAQPGVLIFDLNTIQVATPQNVQVTTAISPFLRDGSKLVVQADLASERGHLVSESYTTTVRSLCISLWHEPKPIAVLDTVTYTVVVTSWDSLTLDDPKLRLTLPLNLDLITPSNGGVFDTNDNTVKWNGLSADNQLSSGEVITEYVNARILPVPDGTILPSQVLVWDTQALTVTDGTNVQVIAPVLLESWMEALPTQTPIDHVYDEVVTYTLYIYNSGTIIATDVMVTMTLPLTTTYEPDSGFSSTGVEPNYNLAQRLAHWTGDIPPGATETIGFAIRVNEPLLDMNPLTVNATIYDNQVPEIIYESVSPLYRGQPDLILTKSVVPAGPIPAGTRLDYTLTLQNLGDAHATNLRITDPLVGEVDFVDASSGHAFDGPNNLYWLLDELQVGQTAIFTLSVDTTGSWVVNQAFVDSEQTNELPSNVVSSAVLEISKVAHTDVISAGEQITYTLTITNGGAIVLNDVVIRDWLPANTTFASASDNGNYEVGPNSVVWPNLTIPANSTLSRQMVVNVATPLISGTVINNNHYEVDCSNCAVAIPGNSVPVTVFSNPQLELVKTATLGPWPIEHTFHYTLTLANVGNEHAANVTITDTLPAGLVVVNNNFENGCPQINGQITCRAAGLDVFVGQQIVRWVEVYVGLNFADEHLLVNDSYGAGNGVDMAQTNGPLLRTVAAPNLMTETNIIPNPVAPGDEITFVLTVTNQGSLSATNLYIEQFFPPEVTDPISLDWPNMGDIAPNQTIVVSTTRVVRSTPFFPDGYLLNNTFIISASNIPAEINVPASAEIYNFPNLSPSTLKLADLYVDDTTNEMLLTYTLTLTNIGRTVAETSIDVTEPGDKVTYVVGSVSPPNGISTHAGGFTWDGQLGEDMSYTIEFAMKVDLLEHALVVSPTVTPSSEPITALLQIPMTTTLPHSHLLFDPLELIIPILDTTYRLNHCAPTYTNPVGLSLSYEEYVKLFQPYQAYTPDGRLYYEKYVSHLLEDGICDGMVATSILSYHRPDRITDDIFMCTIEDDLNVAIGKQIVQAGTQTMIWRASNYATSSDFFDLLWTHIITDSGNTWRLDPWILGLEQNMESCDNSQILGHAVFPYRITQVEQIVYLDIYDPNFAHDPNRRIEIDLETDTWTYFMAGQADPWQGTYFRFVPLNPTYTGETPYIPSNLDSDSLLVANSQGEHGWGTGDGVIGCVDDTFVNTIPDATRVNSMSNTPLSDLDEMYTLPFDENEIYIGHFSSTTIYNDFQLFWPGYAFDFKGEIPVLDVTLVNNTLVITRQPDAYPDETRPYTMTVIQAINKPELNISYTLEYNFNINNFMVGEAIHLWFGQNNTGEDELRFGRRGGTEGEQLEYDMGLILWQPGVEDPLSKISRPGLVISSTDTHYITVHDRHYLPATKVCVDKESNTTIDDCLQIGIIAHPSASQLIYTGERLTYTITVTNSGTEPQYNVVVETIIPSKLIFQDANSDISGANIELDGDDLTLHVPVLQPTETADLILVTLVQGDPPDNVVLTATTRSPNVDTVYSYPYRHSIEGTQFRITSQPENTTFTIGDEISYKIEVTNQMKNTQTQGEIVMYTPAGLTFNDATSSGSCQVNDPVNPGDPVKFDECQLNSKTGTVVTVKYTVNPDRRQSIHALAYYHSDIQPQISTAVIKNELDGISVIKEILSPISGEVEGGDQLIYSLNIQNVGVLPQSGIKLRDCLPAQLDYLGYTADVGVIITPTTNACLDLALTNNLNGGDEALVQLITRVQPDASGEIVNEVTALTAAQPEFDSFPATIDLGGVSLHITMTEVTNTPGGISFGDTVRYTITLINEDDNPHKVELTNPIPPYTDYVLGTLQVSPTPDFKSPNPQIKVIEETLLADSQLTINFDVDILEEAKGQTISNQAHLVVDDDLPALDSKVISFTVNGLWTNKAVSTSDVAEFLTLDYTIFVSNKDIIPHNKVIITDIAPSGVAWLPETLAIEAPEITFVQPTFTPEQLELIIPELTPGKSLTLTFKGALVSYNEVVTNQVSVKSEEQILPTLAQAATSVAELLPCLLTRVTANRSVNAPLYVSDDLAYTLTAINACPQPQSDVKLSATLPSQVNVTSDDIVVEAPSAVVQTYNDPLLEVTTELLASGEIMTVTVPGIVTGQPGEIIVMKSTVESELFTPVSSFPLHHRIAADNIPPAPDIWGTISWQNMSSNTGDFGVGDRIKVTTTLTNVGYVAHQVVFNSPLPQYTTYNAGTFQVITNQVDNYQLGSTVVVTKNALLPNTSLQFEFEFVIGSTAKGQTLWYQPALEVDDIPYAWPPFSFYVNGLEISKGLGDLPAEPTLRIPYMITVTNRGANLHQTIIVTDNLSSSLQADFNSLVVTPPPGVTVQVAYIANNQLFVQLSHLTNNNQVIIRFDAIATGYSTSPIINTAYADSNNQTIPSSASHTFTLSQETCLQAHISPQIPIYETVQPGEVMSYTITATNFCDGSRAAILRAYIPSELTNVSWTGNGSFNTDNWPPELALPKFLSAGQQAQMIITGTINGAAPGSLTISATVMAGSSTSPAQPVTHYIRQEETPGGIESHLTVSRIPTPPTNVGVGDRVRYTLTFTNTSPNIYTLLVEDAIPNILAPDVNAVVIQSTGSYTWLGQTLLVTKPHVIPGEVVTIIVEATVTPQALGQTITNRPLFQVEGDWRAVKPVSFVVNGLSMSMSVDTTVLNSTAQLTYTLFVTNTDSIDHHNIVITSPSPTLVDWLDLDVEYPSDTTLTQQVLTPDLLQVALSRLKAGQSAKLVFSGQVSGYTELPIINVAYAHSLQQTQAATVSISTPTGVYLPCLQLDLTAQPAPYETVQQSNPIVYHLVAINYCSTVLSDVSFEAQLSPELTYEGWSSSDNLQQNGFNWTIPYGLAGGQSTTLTISTTVNAQPPATTTFIGHLNQGETLAVQQTLHHQVSQIPTPGGVEARVTLTNGTGNLNNITIQDELTYTITITNNSPLTHTVSLTLPLSPLTPPLNGTLVVDPPAVAAVVNNTLLVTIPNLAVGVNLKVSLKVQVDDAARGLTIVNQPVVQIDDTISQLSPIIFYVNGLKITKLVDGDALTIGFALPYTITVANVDQIVHHNVIITDELISVLSGEPTSLQIQTSPGVTVTTQYLSADQLYVLLNQLTPGQVVTITFDALLTEYVTEPIPNTSYAASQEQPAPSISYVQTSAAQLPTCLYAYLTANPDPLHPLQTGDSLTYTFTTINHCNQMQEDVLLTVYVPEQIQPTNSWGDGQIDLNLSPTMHMTVSEILPNNQATFFIEGLVIAEPPAQATITATVQGNLQPEPIVANPLTHYIVPGEVVVPGLWANIQMREVSDTPGLISSGDLLQFTVIVTNSSTTIFDFTLNDLLPNYTTYLANSLIILPDDPTDLINTTDGISVTHFNMPPHSQWHLQFEVLVEPEASGQWLTNHALITVGDETEWLTPIRFFVSGLALTKLADTTALTNSLIIPYTIIVKNDDNQSHVGVIVTDTLPPFLAWRYGSLGVETPPGIEVEQAYLTTEDLYVYLNQLQPGQAVTITAQTEVMDYTPNPILNTVYAHSISQTIPSTATVAIALPPQHCLQTHITPSLPVYQPLYISDTLKYTVIIHNNCNQARPNITLTTNIPSQLTNIEIDGTFTPEQNGSQVTMFAPSIEANSSISLDLTGTIALTLPSTLQFTATTKPDNDNLIIATPIIHTIHWQGNDNGNIHGIETKWQMTPLAGAITPGSNLRYTLTITNVAPIYRTIIFSDPLSPYTPYQTGSISLTLPYDGLITGTTMVVSRTLFPPNTPMDISFNVTIADDAWGQEIINQAILGVDGTPYLLDPISFFVGGLRITKVAHTDYVTQTMQVSYTIVITNDTNFSQHNLLINDTLPELIYFDTVGFGPGSSGGSWAQDGQLIQVHLATLAPDAQATIYLYGTLTGYNTYPFTNTVAITSDEQPHPSTAFAIIQPAQIPCLQIQSQANPTNNTLIRQGETITYTVTGTNYCAQTENNPLVTIFIPPTLQYNGTVWQDGSLDDSNPNFISLTKPVLNPQMTLGLVFTATVIGQLGQTAVLTATIASDAVTPLTAPPLQHSIIPSLQGLIGDVSMTPDIGRVDDLLHYTVVLTNQDDIAYTISLNNTIPTFTIYEDLVTTNPPGLSVTSIPDHLVLDQTVIEPDQSIALEYWVKVTEAGRGQIIEQETIATVNGIILPDMFSPLYTPVAGLNISKSVIDPANHASYVSYMIIVSNTDSITHSSIVITDTAPDALAFRPDSYIIHTSADVMATLQSLTTQDLRVSVDHLASGQAVTITLQADWIAYPTEPVTNIAYSRSQQQPRASDASVVVLPTQVNCLQLNAVANPETHINQHPGNLITYTITVHNHCLTNQQVTMKAHKSDTLEWVNTTGFIVSGNEATKTIPVLVISETGTLVAQVIGTPGQQTDLISTLTDNQTGETYVAPILSHQIVDTDIVILPAGLTAHWAVANLSKPGYTASTGDQLQYTLTVSNSATISQTLSYWAAIPAFTQHQPELDEIIGEIILQPQSSTQISFIVMVLATARGHIILGEATLMVDGIVTAFPTLETPVTSLAIMKVVDSQSLLTSREVPYTITLKNEDGIPHTRLVLTDVAPVGVVWDTSSLSIGVNTMAGISIEDIDQSITLNELRLEIPQLNPTGEVTITFNGVVQPEANTPITNTAYIISAEQSTLGVAQAVIEGDIEISCLQLDLASQPATPTALTQGGTMIYTPTTVYYNQTITYTLTANNGCGSPQNGVQLTAYLPTGLIYGGRLGSVAINTDIPQQPFATVDVPVAGHAQMVFTTTVVASSPQTIIVTGTVHGPGHPTLQGNTLRYYVDYRQIDRDLQGVKQVTLPTSGAVVGSDIDYTITLTNAGEDSFEVIVVDLLSEHTPFISGSLIKPFDATSSTRNPLMVTTTLNVGDATNISFGVNVLASARGQRITNQAVAWVDGNPLVLKPVHFEVGGVHISKQVDASQLASHQVLFYTISITNTDIISHPQVIISDTVPAEFLWDLASLETNRPDLVSQQFIQPDWWQLTLDTLAPGKSVQITIRALADGYTILPVTNLVEVISDEQLHPDTATVTTPAGVVMSCLRLRGESIPSPNQPVYTGTQIVYTLTAENYCGGEIGSSTLTVSPSPLWDYDAGSGTYPISMSGSDITMVIPDLAGGQKVTVILTGTVQADPPADVILNAAIDNTVKGAITLWPIQHQVQKTRVHLAGPPTQFQPGQLVTYTITLTNMMPNNTQSNGQIIMTWPDHLILKAVQDQTGSNICLNNNGVSSNPLVMSECDLDQAESGSIQVIFEVEPDAQNEPIRAIVRYESDEQQPYLWSNQTEHDLDGLAIWKYVPVIYGQTINVHSPFAYKIVVKNVGDYLREKIEITDCLSDDLEFVEGSILEPEGNIDTEEQCITASLDQLDSNQKATLTVMVRSRPYAGPILVNWAKVIAANLFELTSKPVEIPSSRIALRLRAEKDGTPISTVAEGEEMTYTLLVTNYDARGYTATIAISIPTQTTYVPGTIQSSTALSSTMIDLDNQIITVEAANFDGNMTISFNVVVTNTVVVDEIVNTAKLEIPKWDWILPSWPVRVTINKPAIYMPLILK